MTEWEPSHTLRERLKGLLPPDLRIRYLYRRALRAGESEIGLVRYLADPRRVSIDVGANKGIYSYAMLRHSASVHAFEPNPKLFRMLASWATNKVTLHQVALSNESGSANLLVPIGRGGRYSNQGASLSAIKVSGDHGVVRVETRRLDDVAISNVGFIKIDVEGFEQEVLEGAKETLRRDRPNLLVEMEEIHTKTPLADMIDAVCAHGYECIALVRGVLTRFDRIDVTAHHSGPAAPSDYVFNFMFFPKPIDNRP